MALAVPAGAFAQPQEDAAEARRLFDQGRALAADGALEQAREKLRESFDLLPRASTAINLGHIELELGQPANALGWYRQVEAGDLGEIPIARHQLRAFITQAESAEAEAARASPTPVYDAEAAFPAATESEHRAAALDAEATAMVEPVAGWKSPAGWTLTVTGALALGVSAYLTVHVDEELSFLNETCGDMMCPTAALRSQARDARDAQLGRDILLGAGIPVLTLGIVFLLWDAVD